MWYNGHNEHELDDNDGSADDNDDNVGADAYIALKKFLRRQLLW